MSKKTPSGSDEIEREMRAQQKFSMAGAIGRAGSGLMKGGSPVSRQEQALIVLTRWIDQHTADPSGALKSLLRRQIRGNELLVAAHLEQPGHALREMITAIVASDYRLQEFVRQIDVRWGEMYQERPLFQVGGQVASAADEYTNESVRQELKRLLEIL